jgi:hypothetical protein
MQPDLSVVIASLNGASGVDRYLRTLATQNNRDRIQIIVLDGSTGSMRRCGLPARSVEIPPSRPGTTG